MYKLILPFFLLALSSCSSHKKEKTQTKEEKITGDNAPAFTKSLLDLTQNNDFPGFRAFALSKGYRLTDSVAVQYKDNKGVDWKSYNSVTSDSLNCFIDDDGLGIVNFVTYDEKFAVAMKDHLLRLGFSHTSNSTPKHDEIEEFEQGHMNVELDIQSTGKGKKWDFSFMLFE